MAQSQVRCGVGSSHFLIEILIAVNASREIARAKIGKLEKALEVVGECKRLVVEALKAELDSAKRPPNQRRGRRMSEVHPEVRDTHQVVMRNGPPRQSLSKKRRIVSNVVRSSKHSSPIPMRTQPRFQRHLQKCRGGRCPHVVSRIVGVESVADVTQIAASQFRFETVLATHAASLKQGESLQLRLCRECVGCLGGRSGGPACGSRGRGQSDRFCGASAEQVCHSGSHRGRHQKRSGWFDGGGWRCEVFALTADDLA